MDNPLLEALKSVLGKSGDSKESPMMEIEIGSDDDSQAEGTQDDPARNAAIVDLLQHKFPDVFEQIQQELAGHGGEPAGMGGDAQ